MFTLYHYFSFRVRMSWNNGDNRNLFLKLKSKLGLHHVVLATTKASPEKLILTVVEMQQLQDVEKTDSKEEVSCLKWTVYNGRRKVCVNFQTDTYKLNIVVYRYRNSLYLKDKEILLKLTEYELLLAKRVYILSSLIYSTSGAFYWMEQLFKIKTNSVKSGCSFTHEHFSIVPVI